MTGLSMEDLWKRWRPREGWLPFVLLFAALILLVTAVNEVDWVPEENIVGFSAILGLILASGLAKRKVPWLLAWFLLLAYGLLLNILWLGKLVPLGADLVNDGSSLGEAFRFNWALFTDRIDGWLAAVSSGGRSQETIVFALGLGLAAWLLAAFSSWTVFRQRRPLRGLLIMAFALAVNAFYGDGSLWPLPLFLGLAFMLVAVTNYTDLVGSWDSRNVDYPDDVRFDFLFVGSGLALGLLALSFVVPSVNVNAISRIFTQQPAIQELEDTLERLFAGVAVPGSDLGEIAGGTAGGPAVLPTSIILGYAPTLYETVVMTAVVESGTIWPVHWRGTTYDIYTGHGWTISNEREQVVPAGADVTAAADDNEVEITQSIRWLRGKAAIYYTQGTPVTFDREVVSRWRGSDDLVRVTGEANQYQAVSKAPAVSGSDLRKVTLAQVPDHLMARYTQLPDTVPERVRDLAQELAGDGQGNPSPYDQALVLERFLRQYPYSLDLELPPTDMDPVDYFLFDLQTGYCDYYASAMVVLARTLGLPARLGSGYLSQPPDEEDQQTIYQINAHSWAEIYFPGFGWLEFEPTAAFPSTQQGALAEGLSGDEDEPGFEVLEPPPIPISSSQETFPWWLPVTLFLLIPLGWWLYFRSQRQGDGIDAVQRAYGQLRRNARSLDQPTPDSQTPGELKTVMTRYLMEIDEGWLFNRLKPILLANEIGRLTAAFEDRQYGGKRPAVGPIVHSWRFVRSRLLLLRIFNWFPRTRRP